MEPKGVVAGAVGVGSTLYSMMVAVTPIVQFVGACLGVVATCFAIYFYVKKLKKED